MISIEDFRPAMLDSCLDAGLAHAFKSQIESRQPNDFFKMKLAYRSHAQLEDFFREHLGDENLDLPEISFHDGPLTRIFLKVIGMGAMTFGRHVFVSPRLLLRDGAGRLALPGWLAAHEAAHVLQYEARGHLRFLRDYLAGYFRALRAGRSLKGAARKAAYLAIAEECEARAAEEAYRVRLLETMSSGEG